MKNPKNHAEEIKEIKEIKELEQSAWRVKWIEKMKELSAELDAKYPDLVELSSVPPEEWVSRYPTEAAFDALGERIDAMQSEFKARYNELLAEFPAPFRAQLRAAAKALSKENWDTPWGAEIIEEMEKAGVF